MTQARGRLRLISEANPAPELERRAAPFSPELQQRLAAERLNEWIYVEGDRLTTNARVAAMLVGRPARRHWWQFWR